MIISYRVILSARKIFPMFLPGRCPSTRLCGRSGALKDGGCAMESMEIEEDDDILWGESMEMCFVNMICSRTYIYIYIFHIIYREIYCMWLWLTDWNIKIICFWVDTRRGQQSHVVLRGASGCVQHPRWGKPPFTTTIARSLPVKPAAYYTGV